MILNFMPVTIYIYIYKAFMYKLRLTSVKVNLIRNFDSKVFFLLPYLYQDI